MKLLLLALISTFLVGISSVQSAQGLNFKYYEGAWNVLPNFDALAPAKSGTVTSVNLDQRRREVQYGFLFQGYITIPSTGNYTFESFSDDGSRLYIGDYSFGAGPVVDNDGAHPGQFRNGTITLNAGVYPIALTFFQNGGGQAMEFYWSSNTGISHQKIPDNVLSTTTSGGSGGSGGAGLNYKYYEGNWSSLPDFNSLSPLKSGTTTNIDLGPRKREVQYAFVWSGYINIPVSGTYNFETISDDGSKLYVGPSSTALVNNDGLHGNQSVNASINLNAGLNPITLAFFQSGGGQTMYISWESASAGIGRAKVPDNVLFTSNSSAPPPSSGGGGLSYNYYEGSWSSLPNFSSLTPVKSGTTSNVDLGPRNREQQYAFVWQGNINIPTAGNYSFTTVSDDGSKVYVGSSSTALVNNDGLHGLQAINGSVNLNAGLTPITITYFQSGGGQAMELYWSSNSGVSYQKIPDNVLSSTGAVVPPTDGTSAPPVDIPPPPPPPTTPPTNGSGGVTGINNYYFSSSNGDDSRSSAQAKNPNTPWRSINKLNSVLPGLLAGDAVLFNRGDAFDGSINVNVSGGGSPVIFSSYGNGNKPVINGLTAMSNWTSIGNGVWQASCPSNDKVNMVTLNGVAQAKGRYPNITDPNRGYLTIDAFSGTSSITDYQLSGSPNWTGAEVVIRKQNWVLDRCYINNHSGNTIYYNSPTAHEPGEVGFGYFIQNSPQTLDQMGEWYFDPNQKVLKMYFGNNNPNSYDVRASTTNILMSISGRSNILVDNLSFIGGDEKDLTVENSQNIHVQNCTFDLSGMMALSGWNVSNLNFENNVITNTNDNAIDCNYCSNSSLKNNYIKNAGLMPGMGGDGNQQHVGIYMVYGNDNTIQQNSIENVGYCGITYTGANILIKNNYINNFCLTVEDGGGIYTWGNLDKYNRVINGNLVLNGIGAYQGTPSSFSGGASGISFDDESANVEISDNTVYNVSRSGVLIHNSHEMVVRNNTFYNSRTQLSFLHDPISINNPIRNITFDNNIVFSKLSSQFLLEMGSIPNDLGSYGNFTNNYYTRPIDDNGVITTYYNNSSGGNIFNYYSVSGWKAAFPNYDQQSHSSPRKIPAYIINGYNGGNRYSGGQFNSGTNGVNCLSSPGRCTVSWSSGGKLDGGAVQVSFDGGGGANNDVGTYINLGSVQGGRNYLIKFSLIGNNNGKSIKAFMLDGSTYAHIMDSKSFQINSSRTDNEFLFSPANSASNVVLTLENRGPDAPYWLDNVEMYDVNATITNPDDYLRFEYNATSNPISISLGQNYVDARNNLYQGSITLAPYTSAVLIRQSGTQFSDGTATERQAGLVTSQLLQEDADTKSLSVTATPNPAHNNLQIALIAPQGTKKTSLSINSISGVILKTIPVTSSTQRVNVDVSTYATGVYVITYVCDGHIQYRKFVKQ